MHILTFYQIYATLHWVRCYFFAASKIFIWFLKIKVLSLTHARRCTVKASRQRTFPYSLPLLRKTRLNKGDLSIPIATSHIHLRVSHIPHHVSFIYLTSLLGVLQLCLPASPDSRSSLFPLSSSSHAYLPKLNSSPLLSSPLLSSSGLSNGSDIILCTCGLCCCSSSSPSSSGTLFLASVVLGRRFTPTIPCPSPSTSLSEGIGASSSSSEDAESREEEEEEYADTTLPCSPEAAVLPMSSLIWRSVTAERSRSGKSLSGSTGISKACCTAAASAVSGSVA